MHLRSVQPLPPLATLSMVRMADGSSTTSHVAIDSRATGSLEVCAAPRLLIVARLGVRWKDCVKASDVPSGAD
jgi:hypothetical protein